MQLPLLIIRLGGDRGQTFQIENSIYMYHVSIISIHVPSPFKIVCIKRYFFAFLKQNHASALLVNATQKHQRQTEPIQQEVARKQSPSFLHQRLYP